MSAACEKFTKGTQNLHNEINQRDSLLAQYVGLIRIAANNLMKFHLQVCLHCQVRVAYTHPSNPLSLTTLK